eukprot:CAMPEP_0176386202 /NCGR_PEP_ID=MMETSP0126-20121128/35774_1 /TAXON_ID=141414 ORGANISM="Strombidinopsis acuminatum, Strain SPMC142" /NCGR_SAMPLE_ID=MMETSP0126 /ASSEMBLY_ACC=CAM_ASM_000229 /LENGTH=47 /DNA_ID= /DNA_START= /DNA_END= /DNA_ORIENTATION=
MIGMVHSTIMTPEAKAAITKESNLSEIEQDPQVEAAVLTQISLSKLW